MSYPYRSSSTRHSNERQSEMDARQHFDAEILRFQGMLEEKEKMLQTAADIGGQLLKQNEELQVRMRELEESRRRNQYESKQLQRQNDILRVAHEDAQAEIRQLREEILEKKDEIEHLEQNAELRPPMSPSPRIRQSVDNGFDNAEMFDALQQVTAERDAMVSVIQDERQKSNELTRKAEELQYDLRSSLQSNNQLEQELMGMNEEFRTLQRDYEQEISRLSEENSTYKCDIQLLRAQIDEQAQLLSRAEELSFFGQPLTHRYSDGTGTTEYDFNLGEELLDETPSLESDLAGPKQLETHADPEPAAVSSDIDTSPRPKLQRAQSSETLSPRTPMTKPPPPPARVSKLRARSPRRISMGGQPSVDALEEFIHLTVTAAKINYSDVPVSSTHLLRRVRQEKLPFHQVANWLEEYLSSKREGKPLSETVSRDPSPAKGDVLPPPGPGTSSQYNFFKQLLFGRNKPKSDGNENRQVKLQVRYEKRMFEVRMKRTDTLQTLANTLPRFLDHKPTNIVFYHNDRELDLDDTIDENKLMSHDAIRMLESRSVPDYLKKYKKKMQKVAKTQSQQYVPARVVGEGMEGMTAPDEKPRPPAPLRTIDGRARSE